MFFLAKETSCNITSSEILRFLWYILQYCSRISWSGIFDIEEKISLFIVTISLGSFFNFSSDLSILYSTKFIFFASKKSLNSFELNFLA